METDNLTFLCELSEALNETETRVPWMGAFCPLYLLMFHQTNGTAVRILDAARVLRRSSGRPCGHDPRRCDSHRGGVFVCAYGMWVFSALAASEAVPANVGPSTHRQPFVSAKA